MIHVKISNTETWDYPSEWEVGRITDDLMRRLSDLDKRDNQWAEDLSSERKAQCDTLAKSNTPLDQEPDDCLRLFWISLGGKRAVPTDWQNQLQDRPISIGHAAETILPRVVGPPLLILGLGIASFWAFIGFRRS